METSVSIAAGIYRPTILSPARPADAATIDELSRKSDIEQTDTLRAQVADLVRTRHPGQTFCANALDAAVSDFIATNGGDAYGVWVHYPWARRLVRLLPESAFIELRTDRNKHKITSDEQDRLAKRAIGIVGLSVGQSVALTMAMERICRQLRLADFDSIDLSNLNRLRCGVQNLGLPKTVAAAREIVEIDPFLDVICFSDGYHRENANVFMDGLDLVVDECDSIDVKFQLREAARARRIPVLMSTSDRGMIDIERFDTEPERPLFHGRLAGVASEAAFAGLSTEQKIPVLNEMADLPNASLRMRASLLEIGHSIKTWPQLASDVTFGGAAICDVARRILLGEPVASGGYRMDFQVLGDASHALPAVVRPEAKPSSVPVPERPVDVFDALVLDAVQAPSAGNTQPWSWHRTAEGMALRLRSAERTSILYAGGHVDHVALGATFETAVIAARHRGFQVLERDAWDGGDSACGNVVSLILRAGGSAEPEPLYAQIARRRTIRTRPANPRPLPAEALTRMSEQLSGVPGLHLEWVTDQGTIQAVGDLIGDGERLRILDRESHSDLLHEICWSEAEHISRRSGIPVSSLSLSEGEITGLEMLRDPLVVDSLARLNAGRGLRTISRDLAWSASAIGFLWSEFDSRRDFFSAGRAMQRIWLQATQDDIGMCPLATACFLLNGHRKGYPVGQLQREQLPAMEARLRAIFDLPDRRADILFFRAIPLDEPLGGERETLRIPLHKMA